jgi:hypothetical protein
MTVRALITALAVGTLACSVTPDVARAVDGGTKAPSVEAGGALPRSVVPADGQARVARQGGAVYQFDAAKGTLIKGSPLSCAKFQGLAAFDGNGALWVGGGSQSLIVIDPTSLTCNPIGVTLKATAMAFVGQPKTGQVRLFALVDGVLVALDAQLASTSAVPWLSTQSRSWPERATVVSTRSLRTARSSRSPRSRLRTPPSARPSRFNRRNRRYG